MRLGPADLGLTREQTLHGFSIKEFSQPPQRRLPWHEHANASMCYVVSGSYAERARGRDQECAPRSMVFKPGAERHADQFGRSGGRCLLIEITPHRLAALQPYVDLSGQPRLVRTATIARIGQEIYREFADGDAVSPLAVEGLILEALAEGARAREDDGSAHLPRWLRQARDLVHDRCHEPLTLSTVAHAVGIHPSHLARVFRKHYRRSIGDYIRGLRIDRAATELADTAMPLATIGLRSGFYDQSHFSRVFKRHTGLTPARFRAALRSRTSGTTPPQTS